MPNYIQHEYEKAKDTIRFPIHFIRPGKSQGIGKESYLQSSRTAGKETTKRGNTNMNDRHHEDELAQKTDIAYTAHLLAM